jgi:hypothetical protein
MATFSANNPVKTVTIHKEECRRIPKSKLDACGCGDTGVLGNQRWWCEKDITADKIDAFMNHRHWAFLLCDECFAK